MLIKKTNSIYSEDLNVSRCALSGNLQLSSNILAYGICLCVGCVERGYVSFEKFAEIMVSFLGKDVIIYLKSFYISTLNEPHIIKRGVDKIMDKYDYIENFNLNSLKNNYYRK